MNAKLRMDILTLKGREEIMNYLIIKYHTMSKIKFKTIPQKDQKLFTKLLCYELDKNFFMTPTTESEWMKTEQYKAREDCKQKHGILTCWSCFEFELDDLIVHIQCPIKACQWKYTGRIPNA